SPRACATVPSRSRTATRSGTADPGRPSRPPITGVDVNTFVVGHRGACTLVPENTLPSFRTALEIGVNELELDLRATRDGQVVVYALVQGRRGGRAGVGVVVPDAAVDGTSDGSGRVSELTCEEIRWLDAGDGAQVHTVAEVLDATAGSLQVDMKEARAIVPMM